MENKEIKNLFAQQSVAEKKAQEIMLEIEDSGAEPDFRQLRDQAKLLKKTGNPLIDGYNALNEKIQSWSTVPLGSKVTFFQMLAVMINAGMPVTKGLNIIQEQEENQRLKNIVRDLIARIEAGESLSDAMVEHLDVFTEAEIGMVKSGEASGQLNSILKELAGQLEKSASIKAKVKGALIYPVVIFVIMFIAVFIVMVMVVPPISELFSATGKPLPAPTRFLITLSDFTVAYWTQVLISLLAAVIFLGVYKRTAAGKLMWDKFLLALPIFGKLRKQVIIAIFARNLGNLLASGIAIIQALKIVAEVVGNEVYKLRINLMSEDVKRGLKLADNLEDSADLFPPVVTNMIAVGEQTAQLDVLTNKIADYYEEQVDNYVKGLMKMLEPVIMVVIGVVVGGMVAAIMLPIMDLASLAGGSGT